MEKLKKIIHQLSPDKYTELEFSLQKNNSEKFLFLCQAYRAQPNHVTDKDLLEALKCNENALYVLKSRLYDKVQKFLVNDNNSSNPAITDSKNMAFNQYLLEYPRETAIAMLHEIEKKYSQIDSPAELINIYSALKKAYFYSDKYYTYSQLYNKQVAYAIALEKAEDLLFNFNKTLANYYFSNSDTDREIIIHLKNDIRNIYALNKSLRIELVRNMMFIQILLFTDIELPDEDPIEDLLDNSEKALASLAGDAQAEHYKIIFSFFRFEYYNKINQLKKSLPYFEIVNAESHKWLLKSNICLSLKFLFSKIEMALKTNKKEQLANDSEDYYHDANDFFTIVALKLYKGIGKYYAGKIKEATVILNKLLDDVSLLSFPHIELEIKLSLAYFYFKQGEFELADNLLKNLKRKLAASSQESYNNAKAFIKLLNVLINDKDNKSFISKKNTAIEQFNFYNFKERKILEHLQPELDILEQQKK